MSKALLQQALMALEVATTPLARDRQTVLAAIKALRAELEKPEPEPIAWMWQHEETGRIGFVEAQQVESGMWEIGNPRLRLIRSLCACQPKQTQPTEIESPPV